MKNNSQQKFKRKLPEKIYQLSKAFRHCGINYKVYARLTQVHLIGE